MKQIFLLELPPRVQPADAVDYPNNPATVESSTGAPRENIEPIKDDIRDNRYSEKTPAPIDEKETEADGGEKEGKSVPDGWAGQLKVVLRRESSASDLRDKAHFKFPPKKLKKMFSV